MIKTERGNYFEDFSLGQVIVHATPRTVTRGDAALYAALTGSRFAQQCARHVACKNGLDDIPLDDFLVFHIVFGKSVPDISINAVANLGYADGHFKALVFPGDTIRARSEVIGLKENSSGKTGIVYVRTSGRNQHGHEIVSYVRWVMVNKRDPKNPAPQPVVPSLPTAVAASELGIPTGLGPMRIDPSETGSRFSFEDYAPGERIDHMDGMGVMEAEHRLATRLYQNTARVHFDDYHQRQGRLGSVIVYGGVVISLARALSFNGLGNAFHVLAVNAGRHINPCVAGDTVFAWSEVIEKAELGRDDAGALRLRLIATKNRPCDDFPHRQSDGDYDPSLLLDFDYWVLMPKRSAFV